MRVGEPKTNDEERNNRRKINANVDVFSSEFEPDSTHLQENKLSARQGSENEETSRNNTHHIHRTHVDETKHRCTKTHTHRRVDVLVGLVRSLVVLVLDNYGRPLSRPPMLAYISQIVCVQQYLIVDAVLRQNGFVAVCEYEELAEVGDVRLGVGVSSRQGHVSQVKRKKAFLLASVFLRRMHASPS